jgi:hypothetical protein
VVLYRTFVSFNLDSIKPGKMPIKASITFNKFMGGNCAVEVYVLGKQWSGDSKDLFDDSKIIPTICHNPANFLLEAQHWLKNPNSNFGLLFVYTNKSTDYDDTDCLAFFENVKLNLEFLYY